MIKDTTSRYKNTGLILHSATSGERTVYHKYRESLSYRSDEENQVYMVRAGDTLHTLAQKFFNGFPTPSRLWWVIAEYQPEPIFDPTLRLEPGTLLVIPSVMMVHYLLSERPMTKVI